MHSRASRRAIHSSNHRLRDHPHAQHHAHSHTQNGFQLSAVAGLSPFSDRRQIASSAESSSCSSQHHYTHSIVLPDSFECLVYPSRQLILQQINFLRTLHHHHSHTA